MKKSCFAWIVCICMVCGLSGCINQSEPETYDLEVSEVGLSEMEVSDTEETESEVSGEDIVAETSWISVNDNSQLIFEDEQEFHWYQSKEETDDNYFVGTYEFHIGRDAVDYLTTEKSEYGVTEEEIMGVISRAPTYTEENFVCFSLVNQSFMLEGEEQLSEETVSSYFGFLLEDGTFLDVTNMSNGNYYGFTKE